jgi:polyhydroxyalkanoate synthesis regulator phasin
MGVSDMRKRMESAVEKLSPAKAQEMAKSLLQGQGKGKEQVQKVAQDLMGWSNQARERMTETVRREVARQLKSMGVATKDEVDALKRRVRELERAAPAAKKSAAPSTAKRSTSSSPRAKRSGAT